MYTLKLVTCRHGLTWTPSYLWTNPVWQTSCANSNMDTWSTLDTWRCHHFPVCIGRTRKGHAQIKYLFVYAPGLHSISFSIYCATHRNRASDYICTCELVEYRANENVTMVYSSVSVCDKFFLNLEPSCVLHNSMTYWCTTLSRYVYNVSIIEHCILS